MERKSLNQSRLKQIVLTLILLAVDAYVTVALFQAYPFWTDDPIIGRPEYLNIWIVFGFLWLETIVSVVLLRFTWTQHNPR